MAACQFRFMAFTVDVINRHGHGRSSETRC